MSIEYSSAIVLGVSWESLTDGQYEKVADLIEQGELEDFPPYFDGDRKGVFGIALESSPEYGYTSVDYRVKFMGAMMHKFKDLVGIEPKLYLTTVGS